MPACDKLPKIAAVVHLSPGLDAGMQAGSSGQRWGPLSTSPSLPDILKPYSEAMEWQWVRSCDPVSAAH